MVESSKRKSAGVRVLGRGLAVLLAPAVVLGACVHRPAETPPPTEQPAPVPAGPAPIEIPRREGAPVVVSPVQPLAVALLTPELERLQRWVGRHLATQPQIALDVVPLEEVAQVAALSAQKHLRKDGPSCAATPPTGLALELAWPDAAGARTWADCSSTPCRLIVEVTRSKDGQRERVAAWSAEVTEPGTFAGWEEAAQRLQPDPAAPPLRQPELNPLGPVEGPFVKLTKVTPFGPWSFTPAAEEWQDVPFEQCHTKARPVRGPELLVLEYGADGKTTRCESHTFRDPRDAEVLDCYCDTARTVTLGQGEAGRRVALELRELRDVRIVTPEREVFVARISDFQSSDRAYREELFHSGLPWWALCYATTRLDSPMRIAVHLEVDPTGAVTAAKLEGAAGHHALGGCIQGYVQYQPLSCTASGGPATVDFEVTVGREEALDAADQNRPTSEAPPRPGTSRTSAVAAASPSRP